MRAAPSVHAMRSAGTASAFGVGFDSGMMIGRSTCDAMSRMISSVKLPCCADVPIRIVGCTFRTMSPRSVRRGLVIFQFASSAASRA